MTKKLVEVTDPIDLAMAREIKRDVEERGSKAYLTSKIVDGLEKFIVWREPDQDDEKNGIKPKKVSTKRLYNHSLKALV